MPDDVIRSGACFPSAVRLFGILVAAVMTSILIFWSYLDNRKADFVHLESRISNPEVDTIGESIEIAKAALKEIVLQNKTSQPQWDYNWDRKALSSAEESRGVPVRTIILVRHGQYDFQSGALTDKGKQQANLTGMRLKQLNMPYDSIVHSTLLRARQTADYIHAHLPNVSMSSDEALCEGGPVPPQPTLTYWSLPERAYHVDGPRLEGAFRKYFQRADKTQTRQDYRILVGHGNIFRFFTLRALQLPAAAWMRVFLPHGSITLLHINPDSTVTLTKFGDSGYFPPELVTI